MLDWGQRALTERAAIHNIFREIEVAATQEKLKKVTVSMMNAVHDLPLLVARDEGFFKDEGLDVEILKTPGTGQHGSDHQALRDDIFERKMESLYDAGACDQFRMCEWGIMKRAVESNLDTNHRPAKIVALGSAMSAFAIVTDPKHGIYEPEQLKNVADRRQPVQRLALHHAEDDGRLPEARRDQVDQRRHAQGAPGSVARRQGQGREPAGALDQRRRSQGCRVMIESRSTRSEAAGDELDGPTLAKMFNAEARAAEAIDKNPAKYAHYLLEEAGGAIELRDLKLSRMLNAPPTPYTRERFNDNYQWTLSWGLVPPGATYENTVDDRAWR